MKVWWYRLSILQVALAISVTLHAVVLTTRFAAPEQFNRVFQDTPLEVILINARSDEAPDAPQAIAQANLAGGGDAERGRATSPLPPSMHTQLSDALQDQEQRIEHLQLQQQRLLTQLRQQLANLPEQQPERTPDRPQHTPPPTDGTAPEQQRELLLKLLAEIERRINEENARPRKRYVGPSTREASYALYYDDLRRKIEERGTNHFPQAGGRKLYGELTMLITVNHDGQVLSTEVLQASGQPVLDRHAQSIVHSLTFGRFNPDMRVAADQIVVVSRFRFTHDTMLQTQAEELSLQKR